MPSEPRKYTAEEVRDLAAGTQFPVRECSMCGVGLFYTWTDDKAHVGFSSACGCTRWPSPIQERSWHDVANAINIQSSAEVQASMLRDLSSEAL